MSRSSQRRQANSANHRISAQAFMASFSATSAHREPQRPPATLVKCVSCGHQVIELVNNLCAICARPAEGKAFHAMTSEQRDQTHPCGLRNRNHCDGWDGNWLDCEEANRRAGNR